MLPFARLAPFLFAVLLLPAGAGGPAVLARAAEAAPPAPATAILNAVEGGETLMDIARHHGLGFVELRAANPGVDPWLPEPGSKVVIPTLHLLPAGAEPGIVVNLADMRLYLVSEDSSVMRSFPIGIGRDGWETPAGVTAIVRKRKNPVWIPPASIRAERPSLPAAVPPGPANPLGDYALNLGWPTYVIHGTNKPDGVGRRISHGCLRLYPEDIERLFDLAVVGMKVTIVDQPVKVGWIGGELYLEVHPGVDQALQVEFDGRPSREPVKGLRETVLAYAEAVHAPLEAEIDWVLAEKVAMERRGLAVRITR